MLVLFSARKNADAEIHNKNKYERKEGRKWFRTGHFICSLNNRQLSHLFIHIQALVTNMVSKHFASGNPCFPCKSSPHTTVLYIDPDSGQNVQCNYSLLFMVNLTVKTTSSNQPP